MSFSLKLDVCAADVPCAYSITQLVVEKIKTLQERFRNICGVEIHLFENGDVSEASKGATLSINTRQKTLIETCNSKNWEDAIMSVYEKIESRFKTMSYSL
jgi:ribosome-associated translation inhibitor RaiA